jgi:anti-anti-sigma factor
MEVELLDTAQGAVVRLRGEAGVPEASALEAAVSRLGAGRRARVTLDLSELLFLSIFAMGVVVALRRAAVRAGARVCLAPDLEPPVREALNRAGLMGLFEAADGSGAGVGPAPRSRDGWQPYPDVDDVERAFKVAWIQLVELEPQVETLLWRAWRAGASCRLFADVDRVFVPVRNELAGLIGFAGKHRRHPVLGSDEAYEVAYWKLYDAVAESASGRASGA